jgi:hypothetical protein
MLLASLSGGIGTLSDSSAENYGCRLRSGSDAERAPERDDWFRTQREEELWQRTPATVRLRFSS